MMIWLFVRFKYLFFMFEKISKLSENEKFSRINFEYVSLVEQTDISAQDVQTSIETNDVVHVLINLPLDFSSLPPLVNG